MLLRGSSHARLAKTALAKSALRQSQPAWLEMLNGSPSAHRARHRGLPPGPPLGAGAQAKESPAVSVEHPLGHLPRCPTRVYPACCGLAVPRSMPLGPPTGRMDQAQCPLGNG